MTQLSYIQFPSTTSMLDVEPPPCSPDSSMSTSSRTRPRPSSTRGSQTTSVNAYGNIGTAWVQNSWADMGVTRLVYFEIFEDPYEAISREKQIKAGPRRKKVALIEKVNPRWRDLVSEL